MPEPLLDVGDVGLVLEGVGCRDGAQPMPLEAGYLRRGTNHSIDAINGVTAALRHEERRFLLPYMETRGLEVGVSEFGKNRTVSHWYALGSRKRSFRVEELANLQVEIEETWKELAHQENLLDRKQRDLSAVAEARRALDSIRAARGSRVMSAS